MKLARLISYTRFTDETLGLISEDVTEMIAYFARVSNPDNQQNTQTSERLVRYLLAHRHFSPFEMVSIGLEINTTRDIARQILRHRSFAFQEFSQRYSTVGTLSPAPLRECRMQDPKNRQNSFHLIHAGAELSPLEKEWEEKQRLVNETATRTYHWALERGMAREVARAVLPEGLTPSRLYMTGSVRSWIHYIEARLDPSTQYEHRLVAQACKDEIARIFPAINTPPRTPTPTAERYGQD